ncbi:potassium channel family protein [Buttiauxella massiliensis]|uniref:potassium channel family protein n=1 Tax=Buttiauxella massiliensis TaxID=2831590 RepID=UPI00125EF034|nr:potassium channel family protein [Buttiauxella massiliensis]
MILKHVLKLCQLHLARLSWFGLMVMFVVHYISCYWLLRCVGEQQLTSNVIDFIYYSSVLGSTIGFGDLSPTTAGGRLFTAIWQIPVGIGLFGALMGKVISIVQMIIKKGLNGMADFSGLQNHVIVVGWRGHQTQKMISLLLVDERRQFNRVLLCEPNELDSHPFTSNSLVDFARISNFNDPSEQQRIALSHCHSVIIYALNDEQTFTIALSIAGKVPASSHVVVYLEDERYATLLEVHCPNIEINRNLSAEQLARSMQDPGSSQSIATMVNPLIGDTGCVLAIPDDAGHFQYGDLMRYMKVVHDATVIGISQYKNGRDVELNPVISTLVKGGMWLHMIGNARILAQDVAWSEIGK